MGRYYNSAFLIGKDYRVSYRKNHLVPFGEFIPLKKYLGYVYQNWLNIPFTNLSKGKQKSVPLFKIKDLHFAIKEVEDASFHLSWVDPTDIHEKFSERLMEIAYLLNIIKEKL